MKKNYVSKHCFLYSILLIVFCCCSIACSSKNDLADEEPVKPEKVYQEFKVFQLNTWFGASQVANAYSGLVDIIDQVDADIVLLCELRNDLLLNILHDGEKEFTARLCRSLKDKGKTYYGINNGTVIGILSKYEIKNYKVLPTPTDNYMIKVTVDIRGQEVTFYSLHLDYKHYACYLPRGYNSGPDWSKLSEPVKDSAVVMKDNRLGTRDEALSVFLDDAKSEMDRCRVVVMGGDFNEPSYLDWQENTKDLHSHNGVVANWDCSLMLKNAGYVDTYREKYPDPVDYPGFTFPAANPSATIGQLSFCPEYDERDRIDFVYYHRSQPIQLLKAELVGPSGSVYFGKKAENDSKDVFIEPKGVWPTDHKGNLTTFKLRVKK